MTNRKVTKGQRYVQYKNTMTIGKVTKGQTINDQRKSYKRTENTMTNGKVTKGHTIQ